MSELGQVLRALQRVQHALDEHEARLGQVEHLPLRDLSCRVVVLERLAGVSTGPQGRHERRTRVSELVAAGLSNAAIGRVVSAHAATIANDREALGLPASGPNSVGADGVPLGRRAYNGRNGNGNGASGR